MRGGHCHNNGKDTGGIGGVGFRCCGYTETKDGERNK